MPRLTSGVSWAVLAITYLALLPVWLFSAFFVVALEDSDRFGEAAAVAVGVVVVLLYFSALPGAGASRVVDRWAAGHEVDRLTALESTYAWARGAVVRCVWASAVWVGLLFAVVGAVAGATGSHLVQYGIVGVVFGTVTSLVPVHSFVEATMRPARTAIAGDTGIGV